MVKDWGIICLTNLFLTGVMGFLLRISQYFNIMFPYSNLLHSHSHIAILGWLYLMFFTLIYVNFIPKNYKNKILYNRLFWITQFSVIGMAISFIYSGYGIYSISFSTLHIFCSYFFCRLTWKNLSSNFIDVLFLKTALFFMIISTLGVWVLALIIPIEGKNSSLYSVAIQFFIHFQISGWFFMGIFSFLFNLIKKHYNYPPKRSFLFYLLTTVAIISTFAYPVSWYYSGNGLYITTIIGSLSQLGALILFFSYINPLIIQIISNEFYVTKHLYFLFVACYVLKTFIQLSLIISKISEYAHVIKNLSLGFIHLVVLGIYTILLLFFLTKDKVFLNAENNLVKIGIYLFISIFVFSEFLLFLQGIFVFYGIGLIPGYLTLISWSSLLFPISILLLLISAIKSRKIVVPHLS